MVFTNRYESPFGGITLASDGEVFTGLWFDGQKYFGCTLSSENDEKQLPVFTETKEWLDCYFGGNEPDFIPTVKMDGSEFRLAVWEILKQIPYGQVITYGEIAAEIARQRTAKMSAQAVGGAVGHNPVSIIVPCHRVVGTNGSLTGYASGIERKIGLLKLEHANMEKLFVPKKGTAL
ncbi:MAG: methylated-DNA--[protein]-cysteine S-methyltransferase [Tannerellaceae bacterium]|nr:methylated-DNA--[protein]-cysteine S-methyltransferase [Tannerellaceae bacterium]